MNDPKVMKIRGYILNTLIYRRTAIVVGMVLAAFTLTQVRLGAEPEKFTFNRGEEVKVYTANPDANSTENVKGMFKGREFQFKKFEGIHDLLSVSDKIKGEARIAPLGGKIRGGVKKGFKPGKPLKHYVNDTYSTNSPHINAESFENKSVFEAVSAVGEPYYFFNNKYFTNVGTFRVYDTFDSRNYETYENLLGEMDYDPISSKVFINKQDALMESASPNIVSGGFRIEADQINNQGKISASSAGIIHFDGGDVDFNKGAIEIKAPTTYEHFGKNKNLYWGWWGGYQGRRAYLIGGLGGVHLSDFGITENYWGVTVGGSSIGVPGTAFPIGGAATAITDDIVFELETKYPIIGNYNPPYGGYQPWIYSLGGEQFTPYVWEYRYAIGDNLFHIIQVVCVRSDNKDVNFDARLDPLLVSTIPNENLEFRFMGGPVVQFTTTRGLTNVITGGNEIQSISLIDELPNVETVENFSSTNLFSVPLSNQENPDNFVVSRYLTAEFDDGAKANSILDGLTFSYNTESPITFQQASVGIRITNILSRLNANVMSTSYAKTLGGTNRNLEPVMSSEMLVDIANGRSDLPVPDVDGANVMDQPGRVKIKAKNLDLTNTRIRAEGGIWVETEHLTSSSNAVLDCQNLYLNLGSTNGLLVVENFAPDYVERSGGVVEASSLAWENKYTIQVFNGSDFEDREVSTVYSFLIADGQFSLTNKVHAHEVILNSEKVIIEDKLHVLNNFSLKETEELVLNNYLKLGTGPNSGQYYWDKTVAPVLHSLEINGVLDVPEIQKFGTDREFPYDNWVNNGTNRAYNTYIHAKAFENNGYMTAAEFIEIKGINGSFEGGFTKSWQGFSIDVDNLRMRNQTNISVGPMKLSASGILTDGGAPARSYLEAWEGVSLNDKPFKGDLLGTKMLVLATNFTSRVIHWPAENRGANGSGYRDNVALGHLILTNGTVSTITFTGKNDSENAIYIDLLEFSNKTKKDLYNKDVQITEFEELIIPENFTVYFATSNLPEELLDGMYNGRLRWVKEYPGYHSSMPFYVIGVDKTIQVNRVFRQSTSYDSDGDGTANGYDLTPFGGGLPDIISSEVVDKGQGRIKLTWMGIPDSVYHIEYKDDLGARDWKLLKKYHYDGLGVEKISFEDSTSGAVDHRFYRVVFIK